jgi:nicotinate-nucleotide adenylyltransferase
MKVGLFFGSFNPVHVGHMIIANFMATQTDLQRVWLVVSPQNPFKQKSSLMNDYLRLDLVNLAIGDNERLLACDIEFGLAKPSYTIDTLLYLEEKYPQHEFVLIMGSDNVETLHKWKNAGVLLQRHDIYVYRRPGYSDTQNLPAYARLHHFDCPLMALSSTYIRDCIRQGKSVRYLVPDAVYHYLEHTKVF